MRRLLRVLPVVAFPVAFGAGPPTNTDVVTSATDAFGISLGPESIGLYDPGSIRGFNPLAAGNVRIDGLYFDLQGGMPDRLATDARIRVGLAATSFAWPAPSGIVDFTLRGSANTSGMTSIIYTGPYDSHDFDLDGTKQILNNQVGIAAGVSYHADQSNPGQTAHTISWGILPTWHPSNQISISTFWGRQSSSNIKPQIILYPLPGQPLPPISPEYYGPSWLNSDNISEHYGMSVRAALSSHWSARLGIFHSSANLPRAYYDLYANATSDGLADHSLVVESHQHYGSGSGSVKLIYQSSQNHWAEELVFGARGRSVNARYGGADSLNFGTGPIEHAQFFPSVPYVFGPTTSNHIHEYSFGSSYTLEWMERVKVTAALRRDTYSNEVFTPGVGASNTSLQPWLYNSSVTYVPVKDLILFGALTRGLEDSGDAPADAVNRGEVLRATRSSQEEIGAKYSPSPALSLLAGVFDVQKSYFALNENDLYSDLGQEQHRGLELSLTGEILSNLHVVAGALFMSPEVLAKSTSQEVIGSAPIGQPHLTTQVAFDYTLAHIPSLSVDGVFGIVGSRFASVDNRISVPGYRSFDLGGRYRFTWDQHPVTLRVQVLDVTNTLNWSIGNDGGMSRTPARRALAYLIVDF